MTVPLACCTSATRRLGCAGRCTRAATGLHAPGDRASRRQLVAGVRLAARRFLRRRQPDWTPAMQELRKVLIRETSLNAAAHGARPAIALDAPPRTGKAEMLLEVGRMYERALRAATARGAIQPQSG